jgi:hypothetical protein
MPVSPRAAMIAKAAMERLPTTGTASTVTSKRVLVEVFRFVDIVVHKALAVL